MRSAPILWVFGFLHLCRGQSTGYGSEKGFHLNKRPLHQQSFSSPCWSGSGGGYDSVVEDVQGRKLLLAAGAAVGGAALGYHIGMKHQNNQPIINNNIYNEYPPPCVVFQGGGGGGGVIGGILGHHPILSNILSGGWGGGGAGSNVANVNRQNGVNWNRAIRQFSRAVRPITRGFK